MIDAAHESAILARITNVPIFDTLQMRSVSFDSGCCELTVPRQSMYDGVFESFHGGILMTIADMNIRFLAPCLTDVRVKARVIKVGRLMCPVAVDLFDTSEKLVAVAQVNYMLLEKMPRR